ncbi:hypothetical protein DSO57_1008711 [Entomophthora muscae]|uniref:Uncharacterized protein n=1 Tax=Entomophthora muscae TaxID=34485 RepID=A0ACC2SVV2_9FUNG|nr:hypothetical protein DSO57_1008711 [Entomophthora muscae]
MSDSDNYDEFKEDDHFKSPSNESNFHLEEETPAHERPISSNNFGYKLLQKMGWKEGLGLGSSGQGRSEPIPLTIQEDKGGVGKNEELNLYHSLSTAERKLLETEVIAAETEEQRLARKEKNEKKLEVQKEISNALSVFYCALCDKQYSKSSDYETHLDSYDHHHKKSPIVNFSQKKVKKLPRKIASRHYLQSKGFRLSLLNLQPPLSPRAGQLFLRPPGLVLNLQSPSTIQILLIRFKPIQHFLS